MNVLLDYTRVSMLTVSTPMEASIAHLVILALLVMECHAVSLVDIVFVKVYYHNYCYLCSVHEWSSSSDEWY